MTTPLTPTIPEQKLRLFALGLTNARREVGGALTLSMLSARDFAATLDLIDSYLREGADEAAIRLELTQAAEWADKAGIARERLIVGEFGALRPAPESGFADDGSRERYLQAVSGSAKSLGIGWALWAYHSSFGLATDPEGKTLDGGMLRALGLRQVD